MKLTSTLSAAALAVLVAGDGSADAGQGKAKSQGAKAEHRDRDGDRRPYSRLGDYELEIIREYYGAGRCPPGLAKKNNGCLPPGIAKKRYEVGRRLGDGVYVQPLPRELIIRLPVLPDGYGYRLVDGDLAVIELTTLVVLDAIGF